MLLFSRGTFRLLTAAAVTAAFTLAAEPAPAQQAQTGAAASQETVALEEVVVTARKREERLQETPVSITAFTGNDLERRNIDQVDAIGAFTPNLTFDAGAPISGTSSAASVYIRGIGQIDFTLTTEPGVGIYLDGVYISQSIGGVLDLVDPERIEVLRGPQGTLFGRNTIGGAINVTSKLPDEEFHGNVSVTGGRFDRLDARASVNVPVTDTVFAKIAAGTSNRDGFVAAPNTKNPGDLGDVNQDTVRAAIRFVPNEKFEALITADYTRERENGAPNILAASFEGVSLDFIGALTDPDSPIFVPPPGPLPPPSFTDLHNILATAPLGEQGCLPPFAMPPPFCPPDVVPSPVFGQQTLTAADVIDVENDDLVNRSNIDLSSDADIWGVAGTLTYDFGPVQIKSITSFRSMEARTGRDQDGLPIVQGQQIDKFDVDQFTEEIQVSGLSFAGRLNWLLGFYHFAEDGINLDDVEFTPVRILSGAEIDNRSTAVFGQATFDFTDKLSLTGGFRFTDERKKFEIGDKCFDLPGGPETLFDGTVVTCAPLQTVIDPKFLNSGFLTFVNAPVFDPTSMMNPPGARFCCIPISDAEGNVTALVTGLVAGQEVLPRGDTRLSFDEFTPHANLSYRWTENLMTYFSFSKGFKSGGFVQRVFPPKTEVPSFLPETANVYEVGFKSSMLENRVRLNGSAFFTDYEDLQIQINDGIAPVTRNAAQAEIKGFELELTALLARWLTIQGGVGFLDAKYTRLDPDEDFVTDINAITLDSELPNAPEWSTNLSAIAQHTFANGWEGRARLDWNYRSKVFNDALNFEAIAQEGFHLLNAGVTAAHPSGNWELNFFIKNLTDERYIVSGFANALTQGQADATVGRPREWGLKLLYRFNE